MSIQWPPYSGAQIIMGAEDNSFVKGIEGDGVLTGLTLSAAGTDMDVDVASGQAIVGGSLQNNAGGSVTLSVGDGSNPRWDLIWINSSNTLGKTEGTPVANPVMPNYPANVILLGAAYVQSGVTTISSSDLRYRARVELDVSFRHTSDYTKIDGADIYDGSIGLSALPTLEKYAQMTQNGETTTSGTSWINLIGSVTKTMSGSPVLVFFYFTAYQTATSAEIRLVRDSTELGLIEIRNTAYSGGSIIMVDVPPSGSRVYKGQIRLSSGSGTVYCKDYRVGVVELEKGGAL